LEQITAASKLAPDRGERAPDDQPAVPGHRLPAWLLSLLLHTSLLIALALSLQWAPRGGAADEQSRSVGIALARQRDGQREYFDEQSADADAAVAAPAATVSLNEALPRQAKTPSDLRGFLPAVAESVGGGGTDLPNPGQMTSGVGGNTNVGGQTTTSICGIPGTGSKFVYVFDRSGSMDGFASRPLRSAKSELVASLGDLADTHQFLIIFYNERPRIFTPVGASAQLVWANAQNKQLAAEFVRGITADGGTRHMAALQIALNLHPDVIFFLTDADQPQMTPDELTRIRRTNRSTVINAIEFGFGPSAGQMNFLKRLAQENGGQHAYVDISLLPR